MISRLFSIFSDPALLLANPLLLLLAIFQLWMLVHALRNREWLWALFIAIGWGIAALWYYVSVYRASASAAGGFELPGAQSRQRIRELQAKIHHIDNAYHHFQLGDVYFQKGKFAEAEKCYRAALERDATDIDTRAHLGQCLLRLNRPGEARPLLDAVCHENYKHDFGYSLMAYAETLTALNEKDAALNIWQHVVEHHSYPRAKVQLAQLFIERKQFNDARSQLTDVLNDDTHAPSFQRKRDRVWIKQARALLKTLPA
jgi:hypothetical protein